MRGLRPQLARTGARHTALTCSDVKELKRIGYYVQSIRLVKSQLTDNL